MDPTLIKILQAASENPDYQNIVNYLTSRRAYPDLRLANIPGKYGSFTTPGLFSSGNIPERGVVSINEGAKQWDPKEMASTMTHELTHAAEKQLIKQYYEVKKKQNKTELETQFMENFQKIIGSSKPEINNWLKQVAPFFAEKEKDYRAKSNEALAFGLENSAFNTDERGRAAPLHIDPTIATLFNLLLDQAQKVQNTQQQSQGR